MSESLTLILTREREREKVHCKCNVQYTSLLCLRLVMSYCVARMGEERGCIGSWWGNRREGDHWET